MNNFDNKQICSYKDIDRFGFICDVCGRKANGCSIVNGMKFCAKCYQETFGKDNLQNEIQQLKQQLEEKDEQIKKLEKDIEWYKIWHNKFKKQIEDLMTELETYRPTKLHGNGQCSCYRCEQKVGFNRHWTDWCYSYKGHTYCSDCLREILKEEKEVNNDKSGQFEDIMAYYDIKNLNELDYILNYYKAMKLEEEY